MTKRASGLASAARRLRRLGATLLNGNRYRLIVSLKDFANNTSSNSYVFAIDNLKPQDRADQ